MQQTFWKEIPSNTKKLHQSDQNKNSIYLLEQQGEPKEILSYLFNAFHLVVEFDDNNNKKIVVYIKNRK